MMTDGIQINDSDVVALDTIAPNVIGLRDFENFCQSNADWLPEFALFMACKDEQGGGAWNLWPDEIAQRTPAGLAAASDRLKEELLAAKYWQFEFFRQWQQLRTYASQAGIRVVGDIPIYVALDSADVWTTHRTGPAGGDCRRAGGEHVDWRSGECTDGVAADPRSG